MEVGKHPQLACRNTAYRPSSRCAVRVRAQAITLKSLKAPANLPVVTKLEWQKPLGIIKYPDPRLRAVNSKIGVFDESLMELAKEMITIMYQDDGVGLAAPQVGVNVRLMVFNPEGRDKPGNERILVNPEVVGIGSIKGIGEEGCLSFPKIYGDVERPREVMIKAQNEKGEEVRLTLEGWTGRIFQHEYDHLQGVLFYDRMSPTVLETVRPSLEAMEQDYMLRHPGAKVQRLPPPPPPKAVGFGASSAAASPRKAAAKTKSK